MVYWKVLLVPVPHSAEEGFQVVSVASGAEEWRGSSGFLYSGLECCQPTVRTDY